MIVLATIPVGIAGLALEHLFRVVFSKPVPTALFLAANGLILLAGERKRRRSLLDALGGSDSPPGPHRTRAHRPARTQPWQPVMAATTATAGTRPANSDPTREADMAVAADRRLSVMGLGNAVLIGCAQILALLPGISRDGVVTVTGMARGLPVGDAVRYSFLLSAPVILAAGVLKVPDLTGPLGSGIRGQVLAAACCPASAPTYRSASWSATSTGRAHWLRSASTAW